MVPHFPPKIWTSASLPGLESAFGLVLLFITIKGIVMNRMP